MMETRKFALLAARCGGLEIGIGVRVPQKRQTTAAGVVTLSDTMVIPPCDGTSKSAGLRSLNTTPRSAACPSGVSPARAGLASVHRRRGSWNISYRISYLRLCGWRGPLPRRPPAAIPRARLERPASRRSLPSAAHSRPVANAKNSSTRRRTCGGRAGKYPGSVRLARRRRGPSCCVERRLKPNSSRRRPEPSLRSVAQPGPAACCARSRCGP
jgi:hypothetical protein